MTIRVARVSSELASSIGPEDAIVFPSKPLLYVDDKISLAASDLEDNSNGNGLGEAVFFSYRYLNNADVFVFLLLYCLCCTNQCKSGQCLAVSHTDTDKL